MNKFLVSLNDEMAVMVGDVQQALVQIRSETEGSIGAGTIWHPEGLIVTNAHVVLDHRNGKPRDIVVVLPDDSEHKPQLLAYDTQLDLAALAIDAKDLPVVRVGSSNGLRAGQWVMALGHPWGMLDSLTAGIVIGTGDNLPEMAGRDWVALSLKLRPGHSGGPLVDADGRLVGINTLITGPSVGFAVPVRAVKAFLKETLGRDHLPSEPAQPDPDHAPVML